jgi:hypothetical protein
MSPWKPDEVEDAATLTASDILDDQPIIKKALVAIMSPQFPRARIGKTSGSGRAALLVRLAALGHVEGSYQATSHVFLGETDRQEIGSREIFHAAIALLPEGRPPAAEKLQTIAAADNPTLVALAVSLGGNDEWICYLHHHPELTLQEAAYLAKEKLSLANQPS